MSKTFCSSQASRSASFSSFLFVFLLSLFLLRLRTSTADSCQPLLPLRQVIIASFVLSRLSSLLLCSLHSWEFFQFHVNRLIWEKKKDLKLVDCETTQTHASTRWAREDGWMGRRENLWCSTEMLHRPDDAVLREKKKVKITIPILKMQSRNVIFFCLKANDRQMLLRESSKVFLSCSSVKKMFRQSPFIFRS